MLRIIQNRPDAVIPTVGNIEDSGLDLTLIEKVADLSKNVALYTTGLIMRPPKGYYLMLAPRSSISKTEFSLANSIGIIDWGYSGELMAAVRKHGEEELVLPSKLVQVILMKKNDISIEIVSSFEETVRGSGGFGSTDNKERA
jgi:dUTP pyrophosphatase